LISATTYSTYTQVLLMSRGHLLHPQR